MEVATLVQLIELSADDKDSRQLNLEDAHFSNDEVWNRLFNEQAIHDTVGQVEARIKQSFDSLMSATEADGTNLDLSSLPVNEDAVPGESTLQYQHEQLTERAAALDQLWVVRTGIQETETLLSIGELGQAISSLETARAKLADFGATYPGTILEQDISRHLSDLSGKIATTVDEGWQEAIECSSSASGSVLSVSQSVNSISLEELYGAVRELETSGTRNARVEQLLRKLEKHIVDPILNGRISRAEVMGEPGSEGTSSLKLIQAEPPTVSSLMAVLSMTIQFLQSAFEPSLISLTISKRFGSNVVSRLCNHTLPSLFPADADHLPAFKNELDTVLAFNELLRQTWDIKSSELSLWVDGFVSEWIAWRRASYLDILRHKLSSGTVHLSRRVVVGREPIDEEPVSEDVPGPGTESTAENADEWGWNDDDNVDKQEPVDPAEPENEPEQEDEDWGWGDEVEIKDDNTEADTTRPPANRPADKLMISSESQHDGETVTSVIEDVTKVLSGFLGEASAYSDSHSQSVSAFVHLYLALAPIVYQDIAHGIIAYNDMSVLAATASEGGVSLSEDDCEVLIQHADRRLAVIIDEGQTKLLSILSTTNRLTDSSGANVETCENAVAQIMGYMRGMAGQLMEFASYGVASQLLGTLLETVVTAVINAIESQEDIAEKDSVQLSNIIQALIGLDEIFVPPGVPPSPEHRAAFYVPSWMKFQYLNEILQSKLVDISYLYTSNALVDYTPNELAGLIRALFADSEYRRSALDEILR